MGSNGNTTLQTLDPKASQTLDTKLQAPAINAAASIVVEADGSKGLLMQKLQSAALAVATAEDSMAKTLQADLVLAITHLLKLPVKNRPKYAEIAVTISTSMKRLTFVRSTTREPDGKLGNRASRSEAYRQLATKWVALARWEIGEYNTTEKKHQERTKDWALKVMHDGVEYTSPITLMRSGVAYTTAHSIFRNCIAPSFVDFTEINERGSEKMAREAAKKLTVQIRHINKDGFVAKARQVVATNPGLTHGAILGLLSELTEPLTQRRYDELQAALILVAPAATVPASK